MVSVAESKHHIQHEAVFAADHDGGRHQLQQPDQDDVPLRHTRLSCKTGM